MQHTPRIRVIFLVSIFFSFGINNTASAQNQSDSLQDRDGNRYSIKVMPDNKRWMTSNLKINIPGSYGYEAAAPGNDSYGRLHTWQSAQEGCTSLGQAWRLPSNEEWQEMTAWFGGVRDISADSGKLAYKTLLTGGNSGFNAVLGGNFDSTGSHYERVDAHGFYWTASETDAAHAWFYNFAKAAQISNRHPDGQKQMAISVRFVMTAR